MRGGISEWYRRVYCVSEWWRDYRERNWRTTTTSAPTAAVSPGKYTTNQQSTLFSGAKPLIIVSHSVVSAMSIATRPGSRRTSQFVLTAAT